MRASGRVAPSAVGVSGRGLTGQIPGMPSLMNTRSDLGHRGLARPRRGRLVAGVAAGLARRFGVSATLVRILFLASLLLPGPQIVAYLVLWIVMPEEASV